MIRVAKQCLTDTAIIGRNLRDVAWPLRRLRAGPSQMQQDGMRFLVLTSDPGGPSGSMGDIAMLSGLMQSLEAQFPSASFTVVGAHAHRIAIPAVGDVRVVPAWVGREGSIAFDRLVRQHHALFVLGADVLDGNYGAALVCRLAAYCNHAVQLGIPATIVGFSFNRRPRWPAVHALSGLHPDVRVNVRGQPSLDRFSRSVRIPADLCADVAFLASPAPEAQAAIETWIGQMRTTGRIPVGINVNAHAFAQVIARTGADALVAGIARQLVVAGERDGLAFLLIPHDVKRGAGDIALLSALEEALRLLEFSHVHYELMADPARIKRVAGLLELVVTARMHLAIASLGMGTPILSITYQDKFEDLQEHLDLGAEDMIQPDQCLTDELSIRISGAIARRNSTGAKIAKSLPRLTELARRNLVFGR
jgi:polysaccharide pyruvyl transferase WcaK-like protein